MASDLEPGSSDASPVEAVDRALLVLEALARTGPGGVPLAELSTGLGFNKSTVHRTLAALRHRGFAVQAETGAYLLGPAAVRLADGYLADDNLPVLLHPALVALCGAVEELVHLGVLDGTQVRYLDKVEPDRPVRVWSAVGRRSPAVTTALGRALLAYRGTNRAMLAGYVRVAQGSAQGSAPEPTRQGIDLDRVWAELEAARARGFAIEQEENEVGICCVAVPLLRSGAAVAAVSIAVPAERMTAERVVELHAQMRRVLPPLLPHGLVLAPVPA